MNNLPKHVAIIMDGNGRWAQARKLPRTRGHLEGVKRVEEIVAAAHNMGIGVLTLYTFSTENWDRPRHEISMLMRTFFSVLNKKARQLNKKNIKIQFIGRRDKLPKSVLQVMNSAARLTQGNTGMILNIAFNYGSRPEIVDAVKSIARDVRNNRLSAEEITEETVDRALYTSGLPDPDLLIRTSGEKRISNFLLWQLSYAELYFTDKFWPDFHEKEFQKAILDFQERDRRYGRASS